MDEIKRFFNKPIGQNTGLLIVLLTVGFGFFFAACLVPEYKRECVTNQTTHQMECTSTTVVKGLGNIPFEPAMTGFVSALPTILAIVRALKSSGPTEPTPPEMPNE